MAESVVDIPLDGFSYEHRGQHQLPSRSSSRVPSISGTEINGGNLRVFSEQASIILVGVRGAGKRSLGFIAAAHLGRRFVTEGHYFQEVTGLSKADYLAQHGKNEYYRRCRDVFRRMLSENETNCVIECGMASLDREAQHLLKKFCNTHPIVYVVRNFEQVAGLLKLSQADGQRLKQWDQTHRQFSNLEFYNMYDSTGNGEGLGTLDSNIGSSFVLRDVKLEISNFIDFILGRSQSKASQSPFSIDSIPLEQRSYTYAITLRLSELTAGSVNLDNIEMGEDAVRLEIDSSDFNQISESVALIRRKVGVPIIYFAPKTFFGASGDNSNSYRNVLEQGLRAGVDYLIVDIECGIDLVQEILSRKGNSKIIGCYFDDALGQRKWLTDNKLSKFQFADSLGFDLLEFSQKAESKQDNDDIVMFRGRVNATFGLTKPLICYNTGPLGKSSIVFNPVLSPVKSASSSQMLQNCNMPCITAMQATAALFSSFMLDSLQFALIGNLGAHSVSPAMHNSSYRQLGMSHEYTSHEASNFEDLRVFLEDSHFGGCSVNTPYKVSVYNKLTERSPHAEAIGAVNTLLPLKKSVDGTELSLVQQAAQRNRAGPVDGFYGENTDWIGFSTSFRRRLSPRNTISPHTTGLVLGAGGAARAAIYAMIYLGCQNIFVCNRTVDAALAVAEHFNVWARTSRSATKDIVHVIPNIETPWAANYQPPTLIISCIPGVVAGDPQPTGFRIRPDWLGSQSGGVVADVSYNPVQTPLLKQAHECRMETNRQWIIITGLEMLPEQAAVQFELMTGRRAPRKLMREEAMRVYCKT